MPDPQLALLLPFHYRHRSHPTQFVSAIVPYCLLMHLVPLPPQGTKCLAPWLRLPMHQDGAIAGPSSTAASTLTAQPTEALGLLSRN